MAKLFVKAQSTSSRSEYVFVQDSTSTTGGGKTGITYNAIGFTAYYLRPGGSATAITLATQTVTGAWSSGGWVEVDATNLPGIYRFDIPNAVFATGVDHAVVMLKGASGMAPVSLEYQLVGYDPTLDSGLILAMGPYKVIADGLGADQPLDIMQGVQAPVSVQVVDVNENGIDITGATVQAKAYNSAGTLVGTYTCTPTYAADGRCTFLLTTAVTNVAGVYSITITRAVGGNVVVFGPLKVMVRAN